MKTFKTVCARDCYDSCSILVDIDDDGNIIRLRGDPNHPITQGFTCPRGNKDIENLYKNRVLYPYKRIISSNEYQRISWKKAIDLISKKLKNAIQFNGAESVLHLDYAGNSGVLSWDFPRRFWNHIGATQTDYTICTSSGHNAISLHYGKSYGVQPLSLLKKKLIIFWGFNAIVSANHLWNLSSQARKNNRTKIVCIDPIKTQTAKKSDLWISPKPGTDTILAFGIAKYLIENDLIDYSFINKFTIGFEKYKELVSTLSFQQIEETTGISFKTIESLSLLYSKIKPNAIMIGIGLSKRREGAESVRSISLLPALVGLHRGFFFSNDQAHFINTDYISQNNLSPSRRIINQVSVSKEIVDENYKFVYIYGMNPTISLPNQNLFRSGLEKEDTFVVVHETHWSKTCEYGDIILPAPNYLEKKDLIIPWTHSFISLSEQATKPMGVSKTEIWFVKKLASVLGLDIPSLDEDPQKVLKIALKNSLNDEDIERLFKDNKNSQGIIQLKLRKKNQYQTKSHKIEFCSQSATEKGLNVLPNFQRTKKRKDTDEYYIINGALPQYTHSQFQNVYGKIPPIVYINPEDALRENIEENQIVTLFNNLGSIAL
ncbi:MAG: molybdopterin-dependent oxidoreductase, partial [Candidatus Lokiarchaeota archaeon]|nr:molybdopterin-dependent oxidoreductase [Candidatus Lokiarchaeota archaeon]MBD3202598.1 molybdopterin-dependent oxidoreductase [Candidatus Lokiarchaeota archaeon]